MPKRTNIFQKLVFLVKKHVAQSAVVTESKFLRDNITGTEREVDICIESVIADHKVTVCIECTARSRKVDVKWIEEMKGKHERLCTNALVLVSSSGFTKEALSVANSYGIEAIVLADMDDVANRLFGDTGSLWSKVYTLNTKKVVIRVKDLPELAAENIVVFPDTSIYDYSGKIVGSAKQLIELLLKSQNTKQELGKYGDESHKGFQIHWEPANDKNGRPFCLQKLDPFVLRPIEFVRITGACNFDISEFRLQHGVLGNVKIAWGTGSFLGKEALLVASEDEAGEQRFSITNEDIANKSPTRRST